MATRDIYEIGCAAVGVKPPRFSVPIGVLSAAGYLGSALARVRRKDIMLTPLNVRLMHIMTPLDHSKAVTELGWNPRPTPEAIEAAAEFFHDTRRPTAPAGGPR